MSRPARIAVIGAGQLARMTALAAASLDVEVGVLARRPTDPAVVAASHVRVGSPSSLTDVLRIAAWGDVVTLDHEQVDPMLLRAVERAGHAVHPRPAAKLLAQDKIEQRAVLGGRLGLPVPDHAVVESVAEVAACAEAWGWPVVLKDARGGYDGRGVAVVGDLGEAAGVLNRARARKGRVLAERRVAIERELSVILARSPSGQTAVYPVAETVQRDGVCREILAPAPIDPALAASARDLARGIAEAIDATGILAVELFVAGGELLINELALRPHNSGHFTLTGCVTSQFENHVRAVLDWPLGETALVAPAVACTNVLGESGLDPRRHLAAALAVPGASVQLYGKTPEPGRKLGHVTVAGRDLFDARDRSGRAARTLALGVAA